MSPPTDNMDQTNSQFHSGKIISESAHSGIFNYARDSLPNHISYVTPDAYIVSVPRVDRWRIYHRLQELTIPCWCLADGTLRVEVQNSIVALLLRSVVQQFVAPRQEMVNWLEKCWNTASQM